MRRVLTSLILFAVSAGLVFLLYTRLKPVPARPEPPASDSPPAVPKPSADPASPPRPPGDPARSATPPGETPSRPESTAGQPATPGKYIPKPDPRVGRTADGKTILKQPFDLSRELHASETSAAEDVQILEQVFWYYRKVYRENPVASQNSDVLSALTGNNPKGIVVFDPEHPSIDAEGRLLDRWGTPYEFHALTGKKLDVWSAGADGKFGTADDVKLGLEEAGLQLQAE